MTIWTAVKLCIICGFIIPRIVIELVPAKKG